MLQRSIFMLVVAADPMSASAFGLTKGMPRLPNAPPLLDFAPAKFAALPHFAPNLP